MEAGTGRLDRSKWLVVLKIAASVLLFSALLLSTGPLPAGATERTFNVNSLGDGDDPFPGDGICDTDSITPSPPPDNECTLRAALSEANGLYQGNYAAPDTDLQTIVVPAGTYYLYSDVAAGGNVLIQGSGRDTTILFGQGSNVLTVTTGNTAVFENLTVTNGLAGSGGGIFNSGTLTLMDVAVKDNYANSTGGGGIRNFGSLTLNRALVSGNNAEVRGGGIENVDGSGATLVINDSTFYRNKSLDTTGIYEGGAISNGAGCTLTVNRTTFEGNTAPVGGAVFNNGTAMLTNVTFANNKATTTGTNGGGAIYNSGSGPGQLSLWFTTIAGNESTIPAALTNMGTLSILSHVLMSENPGGDCVSGSTPTSEHHNLSADDSCAILVDASDITGVNPYLLALGDNGGFSETFGLAENSPAIDAGDTSCMSGGAPLLVDQRGYPRPVDGDVDGTAACDIGAFEAPPPYQLFLPLIMR